MSCLDATFTLAPLSPFFYNSAQEAGYLFCNGADFAWLDPIDLSSAYSTNRFFFDEAFASDPNVDYSQWTNRRKARFLTMYIDMRNYAAAQKQLALIFGFDVLYSSEPGRVLVYSDAGLIQDRQLVYGDNQFLLEIESVDQPVALYFVHAGGYWFFKGLSGYIV